MSEQAAEPSFFPTSLTFVSGPTPSVLEVSAYTYNPAVPVALPTGQSETIVLGADQVQITLRFDIPEAAATTAIGETGNTAATTSIDTSIVSTASSGNGVSSGTTQTKNTGIASSAVAPTTANTVSETSTPSVTSAPIAPPSQGISTGAIAGVSVGCLVAGLIIGFLIAYLFLRRKRRQQRGSTELSQINVVPGAKAYDTAVDNSSAPHLDHFLIDGAPDGEITMELRCIGALIQQHVEDNYTSQPVGIGDSALAQHLTNLGFSENLASCAAALCVSPKTRSVGLRHVLSAVLFRNIDFNSSVSLALLPQAVAAFIKSIPTSNIHDINDSAMTLAFSKWRSLSALLLHPNPADRTPLATSKDTQAQALVDSLNEFLWNFIASEHRDDQSKHLEAVVREVSRFGHVLFSHPNDWRFIYETQRELAVVVCPGLEKLRQRDGKPYQSPLIVLEPVCATI